MELIFGKSFSSEFGFDFLDTGEVGLEALGEGLHKLVFGDTDGFGAVLRAYSATTVFLLLQSRRPMVGWSSGSLIWASTALR